jgi:copper transport protein
VLDRCPTETAADLLRRFSIRAVAMVALLTIAGVILSFVQVERWGAFITTDYGLILAAKIALVGLLLCLAAANRWRYTPAISRGNEEARRRLRVTVKLEIILAAAIIAAAAGLGSVPPSRSLQGAAAPSDLPIAAGVRASLSSAEGIKLGLNVVPAQSGSNTIDFSFEKPSGGALDPREVTIELSHLIAGIEPLIKRATRIGSGSYRLENAELFGAGQWTIRIEALIDDFTKVAFESSVSIGARVAPGAADADGRNLRDGIGIIISTDSRTGRIIVDHEEIPGFMGAMVMNYLVRPEKLLSGLSPGDRIRFTIDADKRVIVDIKKRR